jgi:hypothetical protein
MDSAVRIRSDSVMDEEGEQKWPNKWKPRRARTFDFRWNENLKPLFQAEWVLFRLYLWKFLGAAFLLGLCSIVFRNLAFLQHRQMAYYMKDGAAG